MTRFAVGSAAVLLLLALSCGGEVTVQSPSPPPAPAPPPPPPPPPPPAPPPPPPTGGYQIAYATYVGGSDVEELREPTLLPGGRLLFGARTRSFNMPVSPGAYQPVHGGGAGDSYLAILNAAGTQIEAATFFGGSAMERPPYGIAVTTNGDIVFGSGTTSPNIPTTGNSYRPNLHQPVPSPGDGYVCRISGNLSTLRWCTYTGGGWPRGGMVVDAADAVIVGGNVTGAGYTTTAGAVQTAAKGPNDGFVLKLSSDGRRSLWSTRLGGSGANLVETSLSLRLYPNGDVSVAGISQSFDFPTTAAAAQRTSIGPPDAFVTRLSQTGGALAYSTLFGGSSMDAVEHRHWLGPDGSAVIAGVTSSVNLPGAINALNGTQDGFVAVLSPDGGAFTRVRYVGGSGVEHTLGPVVDNDGLIYVFGGTTSTDFPVTADALQPKYAGNGENDGFLMILNPDFSVRYATYLGGAGLDLVRGVTVDANGDLYLIGGTASVDFPITAGAVQGNYRGGNGDGFVVKLKRMP